MEVQSIDLQEWRVDMDAFNVGLFNTWQWVNSLTNEFSTDIYLNFIRNGEVVGKVAGQEPFVCSNLNNESKLLLILLFWLNYNLIEY